MSGRYRDVLPGYVPYGLVWLVPEREQGKPTEAAYSNGIMAGKPVNYEADEGSPWMRSTGSNRRVTYYRWVTEDEERILSRAATGLGSSTYQPSEEDSALVLTMIARGWLEKEDSFSTLRPTTLGRMLG